MSHQIKNLPVASNGEPDWAAAGIEWAADESVKVGGRDGTTYANAQIPVPSDLTKLLEFVAPAAILESLDGTSWRVAAQDVNRKKFVGAVEDKRESAVFTTDGKLTAFGMGLRKAVWDRLMGLRGERKAATPKVVEKVLVVLLSGAKIEKPATREEFGAAFLADAVDAGVPAKMARTLLDNMIGTHYPE